MINRTDAEKITAALEFMAKAHRTWKMLLIVGLLNDTESQVEFLGGVLVGVQEVLLNMEPSDPQEHNIDSVYESTVEGSEN